jgi:hypothetical protein
MNIPIEIQWVGMGILVGVICLALVIGLVFVFKKTILMWIFNKKINKVVNILKSIPEGTKIDESDRNFSKAIKELTKANLDDASLLKEADKKIQEEKNKNGNIRQETTGTTATNTTSNTRSDDNVTKGHRKVQFRTTSFNGKTNSNNRKPN